MEPKQDNQKYLHDLNQGAGIAIIAISGVSRSVQLWSRIPGSCGTWYFGWVYLVGLFIQGLHYQLSVLATTRFDRVPLTSTACLAIFWLSVHSIAGSIYRNRGLRFHSYEPGAGILHCWFPAGRSSAIALGSDLVTAVGFSSVLWVLNSPIQSRWYAWMCVWLIVGHMWIQHRDHRRRMTWEDSQFESEHWSEQIQRR